MALLNELVNAINGIVWGVPMIVLILGTGLYLQIRLRFMPLRRILHGNMVQANGIAQAAGTTRDPVFSGLTRAYFDRPHDERGGP